MTRKKASTKWRINSTRKVIGYVQNTIFSGWKIALLLLDVSTVCLSLLPWTKPLGFVFVFCLRLAMYLADMKGETRKVEGDNFVDRSQNVRDVM